MNNVPESGLANTLQALSRALSVLGPETPLRIAHDPRLDELIFSLPRLTEADLGPQCDGICPICLVQFRAHLAEEETASAMDSPAHPEQNLGVTRLENTCRHIFCRKDISTWIRQSVRPISPQSPVQAQKSSSPKQRNSCPTCRRPLLDPLPEEHILTRDNVDVLSEEAAGGVPQDHVQTAAQMADDVIREVLEALGPLDGPASSDQADVVRRLVETLLPGGPEFQMSSTEDDYPEHSEFGMYS